jgi:hypothetical protein
MYRLTTKNSIGTIKLEWNDGSNAEYQIGQGKLSLTPYQDFYLLNFWIVSEYEIVPPDEKIHLVSGPILEILTKVRHVDELRSLELTVPNRNVAKDEWDIIYRTGFYNQTHQDLDDSKLMIRKEINDVYEIRFSGSPSIDGMDYEVSGQCSIELSHTLERYW